MTDRFDQAHTLAQVKILEEYHGRTLPGEARVYYVDSLSHYAPDLLEGIIKHWRNANAPASRFPSLRDLRALADEARSHTWARKKNTENRQPLSQPTVTQDPAYHHACWDLIRRASTMTPAQLAEGFETLHSRWPGHDWDGAARRLRGQTARRAP